CLRALRYLPRPGDSPCSHSFPTRRSSDLTHPGPCWRAVSWRQTAATSVPAHHGCWRASRQGCRCPAGGRGRRPGRRASSRSCRRSEEHTSELQSRENLVCRLLLEKKKEGV